MKVLHTTHLGNYDRPTDQLADQPTDWPNNRQTWGLIGKLRFLTAYLAWNYGIVLGWVRLATLSNNVPYFSQWFTPTDSISQYPIRNSFHNPPPSGCGHPSRLLTQAQPVSTCLSPGLASGFLKHRVGPIGKEKNLDRVLGAIGHYHWNKCSDNCQPTDGYKGSWVSYTSDECWVGVSDWFQFRNHLRK